MDKYPEHEKLKSVQAEAQAIGAFLEQMQSEGVFLAHDVQIERKRDPVTVPVGRSIERILADYFEIDLDKVENEKRTMLATLRAA